MTLTREQVIDTLGLLRLAAEFRKLDDAIQARDRILAHDAAQRESIQGLEEDYKLLKEKIEEQRTTIEALEKECVYWREYQEQLAAARATIDKLKNDLAARDHHNRKQRNNDSEAIKTLQAQLTAMTKERDDVKGELEVGLQLTGSFFEALKPLKLSAIHVENPGQHVTDLINQLTAAQDKLSAIQDTVGEENWSLREQLADAMNSHAITQEGYTALRANYDTLSRQFKEAQQAAEAIQENNEAAHKHDIEELNKR